MTEQDIFEVRQTDVEIQEIFDQVPKNKKAIEDINGKLPAEASPENPLTDKEYVDGRVGAERTRAEGAENNLQQAINTEASRAAEAERVLDGKIAAEEARAEGAEQTLDGKIATEKTRAEGVESTLDGKIAAEKARAEGAEQTLDGKIATEKTRAEGVESTLDGKIATEKTRAEGAEQTLEAGKQKVITNLATIAMGSGVSHDDTYSSIRTAAIADFILLTNATVDILFTTPINAADATLNVSATGAKPLRILGQSLPAGVVKAQTYATLVYDGTAWNIVNLFCPDAQFDPAALLVDMGLPSGVKWAARDIDLTKPGGFCETPFTYEKSFFSWGNIDGHNPISNSAFDYNWGSVNESEPYYDGQPYGDTPGNTLTGNIAVGEDFDAARANLGAPWRMPTNGEYGELFANIIYIDANGDEVDTTKADKRVSVNGVLGLYIQSKINGARLFFSCSGYGFGRSWYYRGSYGRYWSSTFFSARDARFLSFNSGGVFPQSNSGRYYGFALRPVQ
jgi:hypothetical protein